MPYEKIGNNEPVCIADEVPFEIPDSWEWVRLKDIAIKEIKRGKSPKYGTSGTVYVFAQKCNVKTGGIDISLSKFLDMNTFGKYPEEEYMQDGDIVINSTGNGTLGRIGVFCDSDRINGNIIVPDSHVAVVRITKTICREYLFYALKYYQPYLEKLGEGSTNQTELKPNVIADLFIPLPPIEEQKKIVDKLLPALNLSDKYGETEKILKEYNAKFPNELKKSILQEAVQGKLVPQDENDEPASVLLDRIRAEKDALIKSGKIKKDKNESIIFRRDNSHYEKRGSEEVCIDDELPFEIPSSWQWCRLGEIEEINLGFTYKPKYTESGVHFLSVKDISGGKIDFTKTQFVSKETYENASYGSKPRKGDILFGRVGTLGKPQIIDVDAEFCIFVSLGFLRDHTNIINKSYICAWMESPLFWMQVYEKVKGSTVKNLNTSWLKDFFIPIPPLSEQSRIVSRLAKIEKLYCKL